MLTIHRKSEKKKTRKSLRCRVNGDSGRVEEVKLGWHIYYQRVLLSGTKVKCCLVQHFHKVLQTGHIDFVFHRLRRNKFFTVDLKMSKIKHKCLHRG